ncbi:unnamed protein product [Effrenium voratum]|nr:unnamed protein product [Effrenium voratum]
MATLGCWRQLWELDPRPTATHVFHASPRLLSSRVHLASPPVSARAQPSPQALPQSPNLSQTFPMHLSQTIQPMQLTQSHSSQPTLLTQTTQATQPTQQILPTKLAQPTQTPHPTQPTQPNKPSHLPQPPSQPPQPPQPLQPLQPAQSPQLCSSGTPVVPAPDLGLRNHSLDQMSQTYGNLPWVDVGTWTPPPSHMSRSASTQPSQRRELRPASPLPNRLGDLGGTMRSASPISRFDGVRISPSPLSARQLPAPRSGSPLQTRAQAVDAPAMLRQRTLPCDLGLPPDRPAVILTGADGARTPTSRASFGRTELTSDRPPARAVRESSSAVESLHRRRWRRPSGPAPGANPATNPGVQGAANEFTPAFFRLQEKLSYLAEEGTVSL